MGMGNIFFYLVHTLGMNYHLSGTCAHHGPAVSRFLVSNGSNNGAKVRVLRGLLRLIKTHFENISGMAF